MSSFSSGQLQIKTKTWTRDSYGLYDYETPSLKLKDFTVTGPCTLFRKDNEIEYSNPFMGLNSNDKRETIGDLKEASAPIVSIFETPEGIQIVSNPKEKAGPDDFWSIVERGENMDGHKLKVNDIIRVGRVVFKINQIKVVQNSDPTLNPPQNSIISTIKEHMQKDEEKESDLENEKNEKVEEKYKEIERKNSSTCPTCKICLSDKEEMDDPLISPCSCTGSVRFVHLQCMQNWVKSKLNMQQNKNIITIYWKNLYCEICKHKLPINFWHKGEELFLIPIGNKLTGSYVIIESFSKENDSTGIHLVDLSSNQDFKMGRGHDCDLKIHDISVSRIHAFLVASKGNLYLKDNLSKFGTLVLHKGPILVSHDVPSSPWVQCGRTVFKFTLKKTWLGIIPCIGSLFGMKKPLKLLEEGNSREDTNQLIGKDSKKENNKET